MTITALRIYMVHLVVLVVLVNLKDGDSCGSGFIDLQMPLTVDYSTNVGDIVYTLINENDPVAVEIEANTYFELNPTNDHEVILKACLPRNLIQSIGFKVVGDTSFCYLNSRSGPAVLNNDTFDIMQRSRGVGMNSYISQNPRGVIRTPVFTNPSNVILSTDITAFGELVLFHVTLDNDVCGSFICTASCTNVPEMNPTVDSGSLEVRTMYFGLEYNVVYSVDVQCLDSNKQSFVTANHTMTVLVTFVTSTQALETTSTTTTTPLTSTTMTTTTTTTSTTTTSTSTSTTTTPTTTVTTPTTTVTTTFITTTPTTTTTTRSTTTTPTTTPTTPTTTTTTSKTTTTTPTTTTTLPTTTTTAPTTSSTTPSTTTPTLTTTSATPSTTTTIPSSVTTTRTTTANSPTATTASTITTSATTTTSSTTITTILPTTTTQPTTTLTTHTTTQTPSTLVSSTPTATLETSFAASTTTANPLTTVSASSQSRSANALGSSGIDNPDTSTLNTPAIGAGAGVAGVAAAGLVAFTIYRKLSGAGSVLPGPGGSSNSNNNNDKESLGGSSDSSTTNLMSNSGGPRRPSLVPVEVNELDFV